MTISSKSSARKLHEAIEGIEATAGAVVTWGDLRNFMHGATNHPDRVCVKALRFSAGQALPETFDVWDQFAWRQEAGIVYVPVRQQNCAADRETTIQDWTRDLDAQNGPAPETPVKIYWTTSAENPASDAQAFNCSVVYDDQTNVVFVVKDLAGTGKSWNDVRRYIQSLADAKRQFNMAGLDGEAVFQTLLNLIPNDPNNEAVALLKSLLRPDSIARLAQNQQAAGGEDAGNGDEDVGDEGEEGDENDGDEDDAIDNLDDDLLRDPEAHEEQPAEKEKVAGEDCNGMRVLGEVARGELPGNWQGGDFAVAFGPEPLDDFKRSLRQYPRDAVQALTNKPVKYCRVDWGNPAGAKKAYLDVYRNFRFFVFESADDIRWYQSNKGRAAFFRLAAGRTPGDMYAMLRSGKSGQEFIGFFYGRIRAEARSGGSNLACLWSADPGFRQMASAATAGTRTEPTPTGRKITEYRRRKYIVDVIAQRLMRDFVDRREVIYIPITKNSNRDEILVGRAPRIRYGLRHYIKHTFGKGDAQRLANSYDDWHWQDNPSTQAARALLDRLRRALDPTGIEPPPPEEKITLPPEEQAKLDRALDAANKKLDGTGIEVQVTVPGHKPRYKWQNGYAAEQAKNWPNDGRFFAVMIAGIDQTKLFDRDAEAFLREMGMWRFVQPAFEEAKKEYDDIRLAVALDNGI